MINRDIESIILYPVGLKLQGLEDGIYYCARNLNDSILIPITLTKRINARDINIAMKKLLTGCVFFVLGMFNKKLLPEKNSISKAGT